MKVTSNEISGYRIESIVISNSRFALEDSYVGQKKANDIDLDIKLNRLVTSRIAKCSLTVDVKITDKENAAPIADLSVTSIGTFEQRVDEPNIAIDDFAKLNAMVIIYPFIREHVANISLKAGLDVIMLPSVNFVALVNKEEERQKGIND